MLRITGGTLRGRLLKTSKAGGVRPTQDAVREALFSMLAECVCGSVFVDLFGGTGSVGIEAWSRGAASVTWVEANKNVAHVLSENVKALCKGEGRIIQADVLHWLQREERRKNDFDQESGKAGICQADIIFADPPYGDGRTDDRLEEIMTLCATSGLLKPDGIFIAEQRATAPSLSVPDYTLITARRYGQTRLSLFRNSIGRGE